MYYSVLIQKKLEDELGVKTVNLGLTAGLKTDYYLYIVKKIAKSNDIIIAPFEYENYTWNNENITTRQLFLFSYDREYILDQGFSFLLKEIYSVPAIDFVTNVLKDRILYKNIILNKNYNNLTINNNGDINFGVVNESHINKMKYLPFQILSNFYETFALKKIKEFSMYARQNNIKFYVSLPNIVNNEKYKSSEYKLFIANLLKYFHDNNINVIGAEFKETLFDESYIYDARYHLNKIGIQKRTNNFINYIKKENIL